MHLEASYYNKQRNKIELEEQEELVPNVNKVDSKKTNNKKKRLCGVCKLPGHNKTTLSRSKINFFKQKFWRILDQSTIVKWGFKKQECQTCQKLLTLYEKILF
jgi:hypothetical protein